MQLVLRVPHIDDVVTTIICLDNFLRYSEERNSRMDTMLTSFGSIVFKRLVTCNTLVAQLGEG